MAAARGGQRSGLPRLAIPIVAGIFLILYATLGLTYLNQQSTQDNLDTQIAFKNTTLERPVQQISPELQANFDSTEELIPVGLKILDLQLAIIDLADRLGFDVNPATTPINFGKAQTTNALRNDISYQLLRLSINGIAGDYDLVKSFINSLYTEPGFETLVLDDVTIEHSGAQATAEIELHVYSLP